MPFKFLIILIRLTEKKSDIIAIFVILMMAFISYSPFFLKGHLINSDSWKNYYPWRAEYDLSEIKTNYLDPNVEYGIWFPMVKDEISKGRFPHWNPYSFCGTPIYANHLVPLFHLPFAISLLFPPMQVATIYCILMALGGTIFFYLFLRNWGLSPLAGLFGSTAYLLSGWMILPHPPEVVTLLWMPAILLIHDKYLEKGNFLYILLGAFVISQILIAGYPIYVVQFFYFALIYSLWKRFHPSFENRISLRRWIYGIALMLFFGVLISAVQNYPTYLYMKLSDRSISPEKANVEHFDSVVERNKERAEKAGFVETAKMIISKQIIEKTSFLIPVFMWNRGRNFAGIVLFFLALCSFFIVDKRFRAMKILLVGVSLFVFIPHANTILVKILPGWSISPIHKPTQIFFLLLIFLACLSFDRLVKTEIRNPTCSILGLLTIALLFLLPRLHPLYMLNLSDQVFRWTPSLDLIYFASYITISAIVLFIIVARLSARVRASYWGLIVLVLFSSISVVNSTYTQYLFDSREPLPKRDEITKLQKVMSDGRIARYDPSVPIVMFTERVDSIFPPNIPSRYGIYDVQGYDSLILKDYATFLKFVDSSAFLTGRGVKHYQNIEAFSKGRLLIDGAGLRYILTRGDLPIEGLKSLYGDPIHRGGLNVFRVNEESNAFYRFTSDFTIKTKIDENISFRPYKIILEKQPILPNGRPLNSIELFENAIPYEFWNFTVEVVDKNPTESVIKFNAPSDGILYISESYHPRWRAELDGQEVEILKANIAFRAIAVPKGEHTLRMWFDGIDVVIGGVISIISTLLLLTLTVFYIRKDV